MANERYGNNRNLWRKVYVNKRRKPVVADVVDANTGVTYSYDLQKTIRHRDFFILKSNRPAEGAPPFIPELAEYDEGLIYFSNTDSAEAAFNFCFTDTPDAVVLTVEPSVLNDDYVIPYGFSFTSCSMSIGLSAPFSGAIRYRAVYATGSYPVYVTSSYAPSSGVFLVAAGHVTASFATEFTASYPAFSVAPTRLYQTPWDFFNNSDIDVVLTNEGKSTTEITNQISAPLNNTIYFMVVE